MSAGPSAARADLAQRLVAPVPHNLIGPPKVAFGSNAVIRAESRPTQVGASNAKGVSSRQGKEARERDMIERPIVGGKHGWAFARPLIDLAAKGYVEEEFFLSGDATTYAQVPGADMGRDGKWKLAPKAKVPF